MKLLTFCTIAIVLSSRHALASKFYSKLVDITGAAFYDEFSFFTSADPTHGRVTYVDRKTAQEFNITHVSDHSFILGADHETYLMPSDPGRRSARIVSNRQLSTFVVVFDMYHMPEGCGTWPAVWTVGDHWPNQGEIDLVEGVNNMSPNIASLHTGTNCHMSASRLMTGRIAGTNCAAAETDNDGCAVRFSDKASFGPAFNSIGGGWYALERNVSQIRAWFWPRTDGHVPNEVKFGFSHDLIDTDGWGMPAADWSNEKCDFSKKFGPHRIVINLTFCGDWAGAAYKSSGCPDSCENYVNANPGSFSSAYFDFSAIRIYT